MALYEHRIDGDVDKVATAIDRLRAFEPPEGYYLAFSGGKDSQCIYHLAIEAGVKFDAHYNLTTVDPPELVYFIRDNYPDVIWERPEKSMWQLMSDKGVPTRINRWCCEVLKEHGGEGRICVTGVRWAESAKRKKNRKPFEINSKNKNNIMLFDDNEEERQMFENCQRKGKRIINPIVDWEDEDVWEFIHSRKIQYCTLYDKGHKRLGCIGCPLSSNQESELKEYPIYYENYMRAIRRFIPKRLERMRIKGREPKLSTAEELMHWWIYGNKENTTLDGQLEFEDLD